jgi:hypothetical protein
MFAFKFFAAIFFVPAAHAAAIGQFSRRLGGSAKRSPGAGVLSARQPVPIITTASEIVERVAVPKRLLESGIELAVGVVEVLVDVVEGSPQPS